MSDVKLLARWTGWCDPCETERPLVLTETGQRGVRAWMRGVGAEDRDLTLTCGVCGEWQTVPHDEDDLPDEPPPPSPLTAIRPLGARQVVVRRLAVDPYPGAPVPEPRDSADAADTAEADAGDDEDSAPEDRHLPDSSLDMVAEGFDLIGIAS